MKLLRESLNVALPRRSMRAITFAIGTLAISGTAVANSDPAENTTPVDLALVLAVDSSSSVDGPEYDLQIKGYANAFRDDEVIDAIQRLDGAGIAVTFVQWSANFQQFQTVPWLQVVDRRVLRHCNGDRNAITQISGIWNGTRISDRVFRQTVPEEPVLRASPINRHFSR